MSREIFKTNNTIRVSNERYVVSNLLPFIYLDELWSESIGRSKGAQSVDTPSLRSHLDIQEILDQPLQRVKLNRPHTFYDHSKKSWSVITEIARKGPKVVNFVLGVGEIQNFGLLQKIKVVSCFVTSYSGLVERVWPD